MKILYISDKYYLKAQATVICAQNVIDQLIKEGHQVDVIAYEDTGMERTSILNSSKIYYVKPDIRKRLEFYSYNFPNSKLAKPFKNISVALNRIHKIMLIPWYPLYNISFPLKILNLCEKLNAREHYDAVISLYWPFESALAGYWFKMKHPEIQWIMYVIDPIRVFSHSYLSLGNKMNSWFVKFAELSDLYLYMRSNSIEYENAAFQKQQHKLVAADIPAMIHKEGVKRIAPSERYVENWVYTGALGAPHYLTDDLLSIFLSLPNDKKRVLHIYSKGPECKKIQVNTAKYKERVICHDYVSHHELEKILTDADVLVSMKYTSLISAKIFEYMSYEKPIMHISGIENDPNANYLSHYERALVLPVYKEKNEKCVELLTEWLKSISKFDYTKPIDMSYFELNRPEYTSKIITDRIMHIKRGEYENNN